MTCSPWFMLYAVTAILWATYAAKMARQEYGSEGRWLMTFVVNLLLCPVAMLWASIWSANAPVSGGTPSAQVAGSGCGCLRCTRESGRTVKGLPEEMTRMIVCPCCGNKRCPHASDHRNACTNSNEPGQPGSVYGPNEELTLRRPEGGGVS